MTDTEDPEELFGKAMEILGGDRKKVENEDFLYSDAYCYLLRAGELGHPEAQYWLFRAFNWLRDSHLFEPDEYKKYSDMEKEWLQKAADNGHTGAMLSLSFYYSYPPYSDDRAKISRELFQKVVDSDPEDPEVQYEIGFAHMFMNRVERDPEAAARWYIKAAEQDDVRALFELSSMYRRGEGVEQSDEKAFQCALKGAELGYPFCQWDVGRYYKYGVGVEQSYERSIEYFNKALEGGIYQPLLSLAHSYEKGLGVEQSYTKAAELYRKAIEQYDTDAMIQLGRLHEKGLGVEQSNREAYELYYRASGDLAWSIAIDDLSRIAKKGDVLAMIVLGDRYEKGSEWFMERSHEKATEYCRMAMDHGPGDLSVDDLIYMAEKDNMVAMVMLGDCYEKGLNVEKSYEKAVKYYTKAAGEGCDLAVAKLSFIKKN